MGIKDLKLTEDGYEIHLLQMLLVIFSYSSLSSLHCLLTRLPNFIPEL